MHSAEECPITSERRGKSDILLQTLRKSVVGDGYAITELQEEPESQFFNNTDIASDDKVTGYIYVLSSLSDNPAVKAEKNLYKIGFTTNSVEQRIANAEHEPTYLINPLLQALMRSRASSVFS